MELQSEKQIQEKTESNSSVVPIILASAVVIFGVLAYYKTINQK